jgi:O-antigen/teichoic acid export membrane protein
VERPEPQTVLADEVEGPVPGAEPEDVRRFGVGAGVSIAGRLAGRGLNALTQVVLARLIGPSSFGLFAIGWALLRVVSLLGPAGLDSAIVRFGPAYRRESASRFRGLFQFTVLASLLVGVGCGLSLYAGAEWIGREVFRKPGLEPVLKMVALAAPLVVLLRQFASTTLLSRRIKFAVASEQVGQPAAELAFLLSLGALAGWSLRAALVSVVASFAAGCALALAFTLRLFPELRQRGPASGPGLTAVLSFSLPIGFAGLFGSLALWADRLVAGYFLNDADTGVYASVSVLTSLFVMILSGVKQIFSPMVSDLHARGERRQAEALYRLATRWVVYISLPLLASLCLAPGEFLRLLFGEAYAQGAYPLLVLSLAQLVNLATGPYDTLLVMTGHQRSWLVLSALMLLGNIGLVALLAPQLGLLGASLGMALSVVSVSVVGVIIVRRALAMSPYDRKWWKGLLSCLFMTVLVAALISLRPPEGLVMLGGMIALAYVSFGISLTLLGLDRAEAEILHALWRRARGGQEREHR